MEISAPIIVRVWSSENAATMEHDQLLTRQCGMLSPWLLADTSESSAASLICTANESGVDVHAHKLSRTRTLTIPGASFQRADLSSWQFEGSQSVRCSTSKTSSVMKCVEVALSRLHSQAKTSGCADISRTNALKTVCLGLFCCVGSRVAFQACERRMWS
jgi:hypothetical protein